MLKDDVVFVNQLSHEGVCASLIVLFCIENVSKIEADPLGGVELIYTVVFYNQ